GDDGSWKIEGIVPGTYTVREVQDPNFTCTAPSPCDYTITFSSAETVTGADFGNQPPQQAVLGERVAAPQAKLLGATGCAGTPFAARVRGTSIAQVLFVLDGKVLKVIKRPDKSGAYTVRLDPRGMRPGVHRLVATVTF